MRTVRKMQGFTLIELSLSLVFIAILSLTVAYIINDTIGSYRRGVTFKQINTTGMDLVEDMRLSIQDSSRRIDASCSELFDARSRVECESDGRKKFVTVTAKANVEMKNNELLESVPVYGAFCTGNYSYIWNSGYFFNGEVYERIYDTEENVEPATLKIGGEDDVTSFRLLKVRDYSRLICSSVLGDNYGEGGISNVFSIDKVTEKPIDLLASSEEDGGLVLYDLDVAAPAENEAKDNLFYSVSFILGTVQGGINITKTGGCAIAPEDYEIENFDYCAINKFNFAAQATGGRL